MNRFDPLAIAVCAVVVASLIAGYVFEDCDAECEATALEAVVREHAGDITSDDPISLDDLAAQPDVCQDFYSITYSANDKTIALQTYFCVDGKHRSLRAIIPAVEVEVAVQ